MDWDAVKQVDVVKIGDDGDEYDCDVNINDEFCSMIFKNLIYLATWI